MSGLNGRRRSQPQRRGRRLLSASWQLPKAVEANRPSAAPRGGLRRWCCSQPPATAPCRCSAPPRRRPRKRRHTGCAGAVQFCSTAETAVHHGVVQRAGVVDGEAVAVAGAEALRGEAQEEGGEAGCCGCEADCHPNVDQNPLQRTAASRNTSLFSRARSRAESLLAAASGITCYS